MIRTTEHKKITALDTLTWLQSLPLGDNDPEHDSIRQLIFVLEIVIKSYDRTATYHEVRSAFTLANILLEEHLSDNADDLAMWTYAMTPVNVTELIAHVLNDCVLEFSEVLFPIPGQADYTEAVPSMVRATVETLLRQPS